jgi:LysR family transcriptional regulator, putative pyruvate carboxylase regulator
MPRKNPSKTRFYYKADRLKPLRAFCQVARLGSISRAAEVLFLSQPAVTLQLQALERDYDTPLFERSGRRLILTKAGSTLYELTRPLIEGLDNLDSEFAQKMRGEEGGSLHIAAGSSTILYLLPPLVQTFKQQHPNIELVLHNVTGQDGLGLLRSDAVDLAVGSMLDVPTDLNYAPVYSFDPMLIMSKQHPLAQKKNLKLEDLSPHGLILPPKRLTTYRLVDLVFQQRRVPYTVALEVGGWEVIKQYVAMGLGISIVTAICLNDDDQQRLEVRSLREYFPPRSYGVVVRKGKHLSTAARQFIDLVKPGLFERRDYFDSGHSER